MYEKYFWVTGVVFRCMRRIFENFFWVTVFLRNMQNVVAFNFAFDRSLVFFLLLPLLFFYYDSRICEN